MPALLSPAPPCPPGTEKVILFDTNAYRDMTYGLTLEATRAKTLQLREAEEKAHVLALANPFVIWELIGHLDNRTDPAYRHCLHALVALAEHTRTRTDASGGISLFADPETTVCRELFRTEPPHAIENVQNLCKLAVHVRDHAPDITDSAILHNLQVFATELRRKEASWLADLQLVVDQCQPEQAQAFVGGGDEKEVRQKLLKYFRGPTFMQHWSVVMTQRYGQMVGINVNPPTLAVKAEILREVFPTAFYLLLDLLEKFPGQKALNLASAKKKRGNFLWDSAICNCLGRQHEVGEAPIYLATADQAILKAAERAGCRERVISLDEHLGAVGLT